MAIFGNNIKNPFSTDHPHDENKKPMSNFKSLRSFMSPKKFADGGMVDPSSPADDGSPEPRPYSQGGVVDPNKPFGDIPQGVPPSEQMQHPLAPPVQNAPAPVEQSSMQNANAPQQFAQGGIVPGASSLRVPVQQASANQAPKLNQPTPPVGVAPKRAVAQPWQRNQAAGGSRSQVAQKASNVPVQRFADGGMVQPGQSPQVQPGVDPNARKKTGTGFVNLQKMIGANSGQRLGQAVAGGITSGAAQVKSQLGEQKEQFGQKLGEASSAFDTSKRDEAIKNAGTAPTSEDQSKSFEKYRSGQLGAPDLSNGLQGYNDLSSKAADVTQQGKDAESQAGRYNLLQRHASGGKQYGAGAKRLDAMLLGQGGGAQELQKARMATAGVGQQLKQAQEGAQAQYGVAAGQAKQFGEDTNKMLGGAQEEVSKAVDFPARQAAAQAEYAKTQAEIQRAAASGEIDPEVAAKLGLTEGMDLYNLNPAELTNKMQASKMTSASQYSTPEQAARMAALMKLSGQDVNQSNWGVGQGGEAAAEAAKSQADLLSGSKELMAAKAAEYTKGRNEDVLSGKQGWYDGQGKYTINRADSELKAGLDQVKAKLANSGMTPDQQQEVLDSYSGKYGVVGADYDPAALGRYNAAMAAYNTGTTGAWSAASDPDGGPVDPMTGLSGQVLRTGKNGETINAAGQTEAQYNQLIQQRNEDKRSLEYSGAGLRDTAQKIKDYDTSHKGKKLSFKK
jgi:hypothetical protein